MSRRVTWRELRFPGPIPPDAVRACLVGCSGLPGNPLLILEAVATGGRLRWRIGAVSSLGVRQACHQVALHIPGTIVNPVEPGWPPVATAQIAAQVRISRTRLLPLGDLDPDAVTRGLLGALALAGPGESLHYQLVLGARIRPTRPPEAAKPLPRGATERLEQPGFGCLVRLAATADQDGRARILVRQVAASLKGLDAPGVAVTVRRCAVTSLARVSLPLWWPLWISAEDLVPLTAWPVADDPNAQLAGLPPRHPKLLPPTAAHPTEGVDIGAAAGASIERRIAQPVGDTLQHRHVLGPSGVGKSTWVGQAALQDILAGRGVVVIDPKRDLVTDLLARIPADRLDDVVVLDPASRTPLGVNPLAGADPDLAADSIVAVFHSLYGDGLGPRSTDILHAAVLTLARRGDASLAMVPLLLTNPGFRRSLVGRAHKEDPLGVGSFWAWFDNLSSGEQDTVTRPLLNKLRPIMMRPPLRGVFGQRRPAIGIEQILAERKILLVQLRKDQIGPEAASVIGSHVVAHLWRVILGRLSLAADQRNPFMIYIDEVQDYLRLPGSLADALAQARGLGVSVTAAHQHLAQLGRLEADLEANTATKLFFRLSPADGRHLASAVGAGQLTADDFTLQPDHQLYARPLVHGRLLPWVSVATQPLPPPLHDPAQVQARSEGRYGRALDDVEADLLSLADATARDGGSTAQPDGATPHTGFGRRRPPAPSRPSAEPQTLTQKGGHV